MNIKITIKDADSTPLLFHKNELSEVQSKKKNALYKQPEKNRNSTKNIKTVSQLNKPVRDEKNLRKTGVRSEIQQEEYQKAQKKMMEDLDKISKNQASLDMIHNSNSILRKQNQILQQNQKTLHSMAVNNQKNSKNGEEVRQQELLLGQIRKEVDEMRKIKEEIEKAGKQFTKNLNETGKMASRKAVQQMPNNITEMNQSLQNLAQISKNQLEGLQNMEGIKSLQNFNIQAYSQAINGLKRQIVQYQKQSQQIQRQLKLRAAKLQKLQINPNFDEQLLVPYQNYLKKRADAVDLHAIKDKTYEKLGHFDYSKFQFDASQLMSQVKNQINQFNIVCKQYRVQVPQIKIDQKDLKGFDLKLPSAIDQYKAERGIDFTRQSQTNKLLQTEQLGQSRSRNMRKKGEPIVSFKQNNNIKSQKLPAAIRELNTKPVDLATQVKLQKTNQPAQKTVLQNQRQRDKKIVEANFKKGKVAKEDEDFEKYLQFRAREQLQLLYKEKKERLQKKQRQLYQYCQDQPQVYLNLDLRNQVKKERSVQPQRKEDRPKSLEKQKQKQKKDELDQSQKLAELKPLAGTEGQAIKSVGTQVLKEKLKNLLGGQSAPKRQPQSYQQNLQQNLSQPELKMENVAGNFLSLINNTLTQVNNQLSRTIQQKFENKSLSKQKHQNFRRSPPKLTIPKLEEFRPPPVFNMPSFIETEKRPYPQPSIGLNTVEKPRPQKKIIPQNYEHLKISQSDRLAELQISNSEGYQQDFQN